MVDKEIIYRKKCYINFNIIKYKKIDDIIDIINLIDNKMIGEENINQTNVYVKIKRSKNTQYDYICKTNTNCENEIIKDFLQFKFSQVQNFIKTNNCEFGSDWEIIYETNNETNNETNYKTNYETNDEIL